MVDGEKVMRNDNWKLKVGSFLDEGFLIDFLTPEEYFAFVGNYTIKPKAISAFSSKIWRTFFRQRYFGTKTDSWFSKRKSEKSELLRPCFGDPKVLDSFDELFTALDPSSQIRLKRFWLICSKSNRLQCSFQVTTWTTLPGSMQTYRYSEKGKVVKDIKQATYT